MTPVGRLGDLVDFLSGCPFKSTLFNTDGVGIPLARIRDVVPGRSGTYYSGKYERIYVLADGDYLIGMDGEFNLARWRGGPALLNQRVCKVDQVSDELDLGYLARFLPSALKAIEAVTPFATVKHLSVKSLREIEIPLPPLEKQRRIAAILDQADGLRAKRREALAHVGDLTQSIFVDFFGKQDVGWPIVRLSNVADSVTGYAFPSRDFIGRGIRLCRGANVLPGRLDWSDLRCWPAGRAAEVSNFDLAIGDVILALDRPWIGEGFKLTMVEASDLPALLVQRVARIRSSQQLLDQTYLYSLLQQPAFERHCRPTETTIPHISPLEVRSFEFALPPIELQQRFASQMAAVGALKQRFRQTMSDMDDLFASLQSQAFVGEL
jgi:type I restriction enzyme, S subunit